MLALALALHACAAIDPSDAETRVYYGVTGGLEKTDSTGAIIVGNVPPGPVTITTSHSGLEVGRARIPVRADAATVVFLLPTPAD